MSLQVPVTVLWDGNNNFMDGAVVSVSSDAIVVGYVMKPSGFQVRPTDTSPQTQTLQIKDKNIGTLYLDMTRDEYNIAVGQVATPPASTEPLTLTTTIDSGDVGCLFASSSLINVKILSVTKGGIAIYNYAYSYDRATGYLDLTQAGCLSLGETIQIIYIQN